MLEFTGIFQQQDVAAGGGAAPSYVAFWESSGWTGSGTTHNITLGTAGSIPSGDLLVATLSFDGTATVSCTGWTKPHQYSNSSGSGAFMYKVCDGTEGGTIFNFATSAGESGGGLIYQITGWGGTAGSHISSAGAVITRGSTGFDPPPLTPSFGAAPAMWFIYASTSLTNYVTALPAGWTQEVAGVTGTAGGVVMSGYQVLNTATHQPGTITSPSQTGTATCGTIAIKGT